MIRLFSLSAVVVLLTALSASAQRVPTQRVPSSPTTGGRTNIFVPYTTNGISTFGVANGVAPRIYERPTVNDSANANVLPTYNLIYYGSSQSTNSINPGAMPRPANQLRPRR
jgi:hypothetical protein